MSVYEVDMHCHSDWSDGEENPWQLVLAAKKAGLKAIAKTDHDSYDGWQLLNEAAINFHLGVCHGIEISSSYQGFDIHVLGYNLNTSKLNLLDPVLRRYHKMREERAKKILRLYAEAGIMNADCEEIKRKLKFNCPYVPLTRIMQYRVISGGIPFSQANQELKRGNPFYVGYDKSLIISPEEAVKFILAVEGVPVLAHPGDFAKRTDGDKDAAQKVFLEVLENLKAVGLKGLECFYPTHSDMQTSNFLAIAKQLNLLVTGGTDYHGSFKQGRVLGSSGVSYADFQKIMNS